LAEELVIMRIVILDGRPRNEIKGPELSDLLGEKLPNAVVRAIKMSDTPISNCSGCFGCWVKTPGECVIADKGRDIAESSVNCDVLVFISPVVFGGYSSLLKNAIDRLIPNMLPLFVRIKGETHHAARYDSYPRILAVGLSSGKPEQDALFTQLVERNAINFHAPAHSAHLLQATESGVTNETLSQTIRQQLTTWGVTI